MHEQTQPDALEAYARSAGFPSREAALAFLKETFRLEPLDPWDAGPSEAGSRHLAGFRVVRATSRYVAIEVFGSLDSSFSEQPPVTRLYPPFFSPRSRAEGWWDLEHLFGHIYRLKGLDGHPCGYGVLTETSGVSRWFLGRTLPAASGQRRRSEPQSGKGQNCFLATLLIITFLGLAPIGCGPSDAPEGTVYRHAIDGVPGSLDPAHASDIYSAILVTNVFDTLYRYKYLARPYELTPNLASDFPEVSDDGLTYTISLREDAHFSDDPAFPDGRGRGVNASDVIYSLRRHFDPATRSQGAWVWRGRILGLDEWAENGADPDDPVKGLRAVDEHTVEIELTEPYPQLTHTLAMALSAVVPHEAVAHYGREFGVRPVGSGPFDLVRFDETRAVLEPNPSFDRGVLDLEAEGYVAGEHGRYGLDGLDGRQYPFVDRLEVHFITEPNARWWSFSSGEVDTVMVPSELSGRVLSSTDPLAFRPDISERYHALAAPESGFVFYGFNMDNPEIGHNDDPERDRKNQALRCAMRDAFDWAARNNTFYHGLGEVFAGVIPPIVGDYHQALPGRSIEHRPDQARETLSAHEWDEGSLPSLVYGLEASVHQRQMFEQFRSQMAAVGLPESIFDPVSFASFGEYSRALGNRRLDLFMYGWTMAYPDPQYALQLFYGPNAAPGANSFNYSNPAFDELFDRASVLPPGEERASLYRRLNRKVVDDCVVIGSLSRTRVHLWHRYLQMIPDREVLGGFFLRFVAAD